MYSGFYVLSVFIIAIEMFIVIWAGVWIKKNKITNHTKKYTMLIYDVNNQQITPDGLQIDFRNNDVAWSFMKEYEKVFTFYNFALLSDDNHCQTIIRFL